jgi:predicted nucleic acid-binding Zn ribbon protein
MREDPARLRDLLAPFGQRLGMRDPAETGRVWARWSEIVGPAIAEHCVPSSLRDGILRLRADSPAWATEVGYLAEEIRSRVNQTTGAELVSEVRVWVAPPGAGEEKTKLPKAKNEPTREAPRDPDGDPQEALARARAAWKRRAAGRGGRRP